jgi:hypothetical protein
MMSSNAPHRPNEMLLAIVAWFVLWAAAWLAILAMVIASGR